MKTLKTVLSHTRSILALPFLVIGAAGFFLAEFIAGKKYTWREQMVAQNTVAKHMLHMDKMAAMNGGNGFRKHSKKKR